MRISVATCARPDGAPAPGRFRLGRSRVRVVETLDQWYGPDYRYIKVTGDDRCLYILRCHDAHENWELTLFKSARAGADPSLVMPSTSPSPNPSGPNKNPAPSLAPIHTSALRLRN